MDLWKYFDITHRFHKLMNPQSVERIQELIDILQINEGSSVIDFGCGKGEFLLQLALSVDIDATGIDISPYAIKEAKERTEERLPDANINYIEMDGKQYFDNLSNKFDISICMGADWIFGGYQVMIENLVKITNDNGLLILGQPFWKKQPTQWYLDESGIGLNAYHTHAQNIEIAQDMGLRPIYSLISDLSDWDRYEYLQWAGVDDHLMKNPDDPDNDEIVEKVTKSKNEYSREGREVFGWAIYVFRNIKD